MRNVLLIFTLLCVAQLAHAQALIGGTVKDIDTKQPIPYVNVILNNTFKGIATDQDGSFLLEIPNYNSDNKFTFKIIGYKQKTIDLVSLMRSDIIYLEVDEQEVNEVIVKPVNAYKLIENAADKIPENNYSIPIGQEAFYRQTLVTNDELNILEEGRFDILNTFNRKELPKNVTVTKARGYIDLSSYKKLGKIVAKNIEDDSLTISESAQVLLNFNPNLEALRDDKNGILGKNASKNYVFNYAGIAIRGNTVMHMVNFDQAEGIKKTLFKGTVFIDTASLAIVEMKAQLSPEGIDFQKMIPLRYRLLMKLGGYSIDVKGLSFNAHYAEYDGFWVIDKGSFNVSGNISKRSKISLDGNLNFEFIVLNNYSRTRFYRKDSPYNTIPSNIEDFKDKTFWEGKSFIPIAEKVENLINKK